MASPLQLVVNGATDDGPAAAAAWDRVRETFERAEQALSRFRESSDLTALNRAAGRPVIPGSRLLVRALSAADRAHRRTAGRFDPRILADLDRLGYRGVSVAAASRGYGGVPVAGVGPGSRGPARMVRRSGRRGPVTIDAPLDLGGIGKGLALRWAARATAPLLREVLGRGGGFLVDAGHDIVCRGRGPAEDGGWLVDIEDPLGRVESLAVIRVPLEGAVATSSTRRRRWQSPDGRPVHHLIDPHTGEPGGAGLLAVSVAGPDPAWAEVWSKTLFLEGAGRIGPAARREGLAAWWIAGDGELEMTPAARIRTIWLAVEQPGARH